MTDSLARFLNDLAYRLRPLLGSDVALSLRIDEDCPDSAVVDKEELESALIEMIRRLVTVLPPRGLIELRAQPMHRPPCRAGGLGDTWITLSVGSLESQTLDVDW